MTAAPFGPRPVPRERSTAALRPDLLCEVDDEAWALRGADPSRVGASSHWLAPWRHTTVDGEVHRWEQAVYSRTHMGAGCSICRGYRADESTSLATLRPDLADEWHPVRNGDLASDDVTPGSHHRVWWTCAPCGHEWRVAVYARAKDGNGCPRCAGQVALPGDPSTLAVADPDLYAELDDAAVRAAGVDPLAVQAHSNRHVTWRCVDDPTHRYRTSPHRRQLGCGCPRCPAPGRTSHEEARLLAAVTAMLADAEGDRPAGQTAWTNVRGHRIPARCDVVVGSRRLVVEYDGLAYHQAPARVTGDTAKTTALLQDGWRVVRLRERTRRRRLPDLPIEHPGFLQLDHLYGDLFAPVVTTIIDWLDGPDGLDDAHTAST